MTEDEKIQLLRAELFTAVVGDVMDSLGLQRQFLPPSIRALHPTMKLVGRAMTVLEEDITAESEGEPFGVMFEALDDLQENEVYICSGSSPSYALWGELMSTRALHLGAAGAVLDGYIRDTQGILDLGFPTFTYGSYGQDQAPRGRVSDYRCGIQVGEVKVADGDIVLGDIDGVCIVPQVAEDEVIHLALEKVRGENLVRKAIKNGMGAQEAFRTFGIM